MAPSFDREFLAPLHVEDLALDFENRYSVQARSGPDLNRVRHVIDGISSKLEDDPLKIYENGNFDPLYWISTQCGILTEPDRKSFFTTLCKSLLSLTQSISSILVAYDGDPAGDEQIHLGRNSLKMYTFLIVTGVARTYRDLQPAKDPAAKTSKSKAKSSDATSWMKSKEQITNALIEVLEHRSFKSLWTTADPEEEFGMLFFQTGLQLIEDKDNGRVASLRNCIFTLISRSVAIFNLQLQAVTALVGLVHNSEHAAEMVAALLQHDAAEGSSSSLTAAMLVEIGRLNLQQVARDQQSCKSMAVFIAKLANLLPDIVLQGLTHILPLIACDAYNVRNGVVKAVAELLPHVDDPEMKAAVLELLKQRFADVSSYSRSATIAVWRSLFEHERVPIEIIADIAKLSRERLLDKSATVRKASAQLLTVMLQHNPFAPQLSTDQFQQRLEVANQQVALLQETVANAQNEVRMDDEEGEETASDPVLQEAVVELESAMKECIRLRAAVAFVEQILEIIPTMVSLLSTKNPSDALAAVDFLVSCYFFGLEGSDAALRKMLPLVYSKQTEVKDAIIDVYARVYIADRSTAEAVQLLVHLASSISITELTCFEVIISELTRKNILNTIHMRAVLEVLTTSNNVNHVRASLDLLVMAGLADPRLLANNLQAVLQRGFEWAPTNSAIVRSACIALQRTGPLPNVDKPLSHLRQVLLGQVGGGRNWFGAAEQAMNAAFMLHPTPESFVSAIIRTVAERAFASSNALVLSRLFFIVGHAAIRALVLNEQLETQWKKQHKKKDDKPEEEDEVAAIGGDACYEHEIEQMRERAQVMLADSTSLIGAIAPCIIAVTGNPSQYPDEDLQMSATLALCKIMCTSPQFCQQHLQLLFTVLQQAPSPGIRANLIIALGDMAFRFPNLIDPWTSHMYAPLRDPIPRVRKNTLMVLSHLILNDMIKVKGEISAVTLCLEDEDLSIRDLAHLFFSELSRKVNNPIYNALPDIVSRLSQVEQVESDVFRRIAKYLIDFVDKERQIESLLEKFCHRFPATQDIQHARNYAFCISCLNITNPKIVTKLTGSLKLFSDKLPDDDVFTSIRSVITKARKTTDANLKELFDAFDTRISQIHAHEEPDDQGPSQDFNLSQGESLRVASQTTTNTTRKQRNVTAKPRKSRRTRRVQESEEDDDEPADAPQSEGNDSDDFEEAKKAPARSARQASRRCKKTIDSDDDSD